MALGADWISAVIIAVTIPLIPLFMSLVGASTKARMARQMRLLQRLAGHFLDVVAGLPTLKVFGRAKVQAAAIRDITDQYRTATMATLKVAFLSSLILELLATISVALVAVAVGLRLLGGHLSLATALFVLILAPEAYLPLRLLGANYHASAEGMKAADDIFEVLERPVRPHGIRCDVPDLSGSTLRVEGLEVFYPGRAHPALSSVSFDVSPGEVVAVAGPSGCGKSTLLGVLLGLVPPSSGSIDVGDVSLGRHAAGRLEGTCRLGSPTPSPVRPFDRRERPPRPSRREPTVRCVPPSRMRNSKTWWPDSPWDSTRSWATRGPASPSASANGSRWPARSSATLRSCFSTSRPPISTGATEENVLAAVRRLMAGRTVIIAAHRPSLLALADRIVHLAPAVATAS